MKWLGLICYLLLAPLMLSFLTAKGAKGAEEGRGKKRDCMETGLKNRVVLVTGSTAGIGRAIAIAFGREGAKVGVTYTNNKAAAEETAEKVIEAGGEALVVPYDLADDDSIRAAVQGLKEEWGTIDVLVNNAVKWQNQEEAKEKVLFEEVPPAQWRDRIRSSLEGAYLTIQCVVPMMRSQGWGRIVNISSNIAEDGIVGAGAYASAKAGLHGLTRVLAWELAPVGILTNVVMPGLTVTERAKQSIPPQILQEKASRIPTGRLSTAEDVAPLVVFLGSAANTHVNGEMIRVTGGL